VNDYEYREFVAARLGEIAKPLTTKRELFAAMVMQGLAADSEVVGSVDNVARTAVSWADALIAALADKGEGTSSQPSLDTDMVSSCCHYSREQVRTNDHLSVAAPAVQAVDLEQFREAVEYWLNTGGGGCFDVTKDEARRIVPEAERLLSIIDQNTGKGIA
jgi:hypothetical protein